MSQCKHGHQIKSSRDRTSNGTCRRCANRMSLEYQRRTRADAAKYRQLQELLAG